MKKVKNLIEIIAKKRSKCKCGKWVSPGQKIVWNKETRKTEECRWCKFETDDDYDLEIWSMIYGDIHDGDL